MGNHDEDLLSIVSTVLGVSVVSLDVVVVVEKRTALLLRLNGVGGKNECTFVTQNAIMAVLIIIILIVLIIVTPAAADDDKCIQIWPRNDVKYLY